MIAWFFNISILMILTMTLTIHLKGCKEEIFVVCVECLVPLCYNFLRVWDPCAQHKEKSKQKNSQRKISAVEVGTCRYKERPPIVPETYAVGGGRREVPCVKKVWIDKKKQRRKVLAKNTPAQRQKGGQKKSPRILV